MPRKIDMITEMHARTVAGLTESKNRWCDFLHTAAYQYKYPFADQVLIFAQKPSATACAPIELWNQQFSRWVNRGAHGIALLREKNGHLYLDHVFDVSDTHNRANEELRLWNVKEENIPEIIDTLGNRYDSTDDLSLVQMLISASKIAVEDNLADYKEELLAATGNSFIEGLDEENLTKCFRTILTSSVAYTVLTRLGYNAKEQISAEDFSDLYLFSTPATISILGAATGAVSEEILREIERTEKACERNAQEKIRTFANTESERYNESEGKIQKGGETNDSNVHDEKRHSVSEPRTAENTEENAWQIRHDASGLYEGAPQGDVFADAGKRHTDRASVGDRADGEEANRDEYHTDGTEPWGERGDEAEESSAVGGDDEQPEAHSGGASPKEPDSGVRELPPIDDVNIIIQVLRHDGYLSKKKAEIVSILRSETSDEKKTEFIKSVYPMNLYGEMYKTGSEEHIGYHPTEDGLTIYDGNYLTRRKETLYPWDFTRLMIEALIGDNNYLDAPRAGDQLTLDTVDNASEPPAEEMPKPKTQTVFPQETIDELLRLGGCTKESPERIYGYYRRANNPEENIAFLKREYEKDNIGLIVGGRKLAASWNENGIRLTEGTKVDGAWHTLSLPWAEVDKRTRELIEMGQYLPKPQKDKADEIYATFVANKLADLYRDTFENIPEEHKTVSRFVWPEITKFYLDILSDKEKLQKLCYEIRENIGRMSDYPPNNRWVIDPDFVYELTSQFQREPVEFKEPEEGIFQPKRYVSEDKITEVLVGGSSVSQGKFRIYSYFLQNRDNAKRASFLADEYGWGGYSSWRTDENHDSKGIVIGGLHYDADGKVFLKWTEVAKRIDELIRKDKYLNNKEIAALGDYELEQVMRCMRGMELGGITLPEDDKDLVEKLSDTAWVKDVLSAMENKLASLMPNSRNYDYYKNNLDTVKSFAAGKYNLFPGSHFRTESKSRELFGTEPETQVIPEPEQAGKEPEPKPQDVDLCDSGYDLHLGTYVHIGMEEVQIQSMTEKGVELFNGTLFPLEMPLNVFLRRVKENPLNDALKIQSPTGKSEFSVYMRSGNTEQVFMNGFATEEEAERFAEKNKWQYVDENEFVWDLFVDETRPVVKEREPEPTDEELDKYPISVVEDGKVKTYANVEDLENATAEAEPRASENPIWKRYREVKNSYPDSISVVRVGEFYEFFDKDAQTVANLLGLTLTSREVDGIGRVPMCGIPYHMVESYFQKLLDNGYKLAVLDGESEAKIILSGKEQPPKDYPTDDHIYVDADKQEIVWMYYNPDADSGGQYVKNTLTFEVFKEAYELLRDADADLRDPKQWQGFLTSLEEMADCYLADLNTPFFVESEEEYNRKPDYVNFSDGTFEGIYTDIEADRAKREATKTTEKPYTVTISFSEHPAFYERVKDENGEIRLVDHFHEMSFAAANELLGRLDDKQHAERDSKDIGWYHKTDFTIHFDDEGEERTYEGRYDLGDGEGNLIQHIRDAAEWNIQFNLKQKDGEQRVKQWAEIRDVFVPMLEEHATLTDEDKAFVEKVMATEPDWYPDRIPKAEKAQRRFEILITEGAEEPYEIWDNAENTVYYDENGNRSTFITRWQAEDFASELNRFVEDGKIPGVSKQGKETVAEVIPTMQDAPKPKAKVAGKLIHPEIGMDARHDYTIVSDNLGVGTPSERYANNIAAIRTLKKIESEIRLATPDEQTILARYVGWGGLADAFDERDNRYHELKNLLTEDEYSAARESTLTAFFTPPVVIRAIYQAIENMGFTRGNILEPSCGVGNFAGMLPEKMSESRLLGVELDSISGRIAQQLYQKQSVTIGGFEETTFPDCFFDVAVGNVPFGQFKVNDKKYDKHNFLIHDYFFAKALDKVRPGGVIAFITSKGTLDKENPAVRKYLSQRADLLGAIRLPDNTFKSAAGTEVVSDIIFLQKRDRITDIESDWVHLGKDENGITMNQYFVEHPDMIMGETVMRSGPFGQEPTCRAYEGQDLGELLSEAITNIHGEMQNTELDEVEEEEGILPANPEVRNFSYTLEDGKVYYRENSIMKPVQTSLTGENRIKGMIAIRDTVRELIDAQLENESDGVIEELQKRLNTQYDSFTAKYGLLNSRANAAVFSDDNAYFLLCSLEILDENKELKAKADMFSKRTIKAREVILSVDTASEALAVSLAEHAHVDMAYMSELTGKSEEELFRELKGVIFLNPKQDGRNTQKYLTADEYLSGNVREKLNFVRKRMQAFPEDDFTANMEALEAVQPKDLTAAEIGVKLGSTWVPEEHIEQFMFELLGTPHWARWNIKVKYVAATSQWVISNKTHDRGNVRANNTYGTGRINAYQIIEETLNLKDVLIHDYVEDENGNKKAVLNKKETMIAQGKQEQIRRAFADWIWETPERREELCRLYNEKFNSLRPREYDGSHIHFVGMNPEITLRKHQKDAVARSLYGGNSLYAHVVGAGKTFTMVAAAQEGKRLGLCSKSMFVVPNHLIEQWATEYLQLYPSANILVATKKDFETKNRKKFCARIATGDYDAVIIGHSQFEKIPVSLERQKQTLQKEIDSLTESITDLRYSHGERLTVKQLQKMRKQLEGKLEKLNDQTRKDDVVCFEELGIDRLFIDEAHFYKNLFAYTKMRNVAGIAQSEAQKSSDLYMKCRYLDELTGGKGITFATGTPISNTMVEMYTMQRYLQFDELQNRGLTSFDAWASTFGETVSAIELSPTGEGYRTKTRFAKFFNIPELMAMFKQVADVQTADMLKLPVPEAHYHVIKTAPSDIQKELVQSFADRAERIHNKMVTAQEDNMLLVTNDGRKAALDQRLIDPMLPDYDESKVNSCVENVFEIWEKNADKKSAQLIFCDLSTPQNDGSFNVYDDIKTKLVARGVPTEEIAFIHSADTDAKKKELFAKVRSGQVRVLIGSTFKMGAGTNVQERLVAIHDLDVPWRPADLEQRAGRIVRQGNTNAEVDIFRYVTEGTFDAYCYQLLESKQKFISQIMTSKSPVRVAEDIDETALSYAEIKALASGNPKIMEKMQLDNDVARLKLQKADFLSQRYTLEDKVIKTYPMEIADLEERIAGFKADIETVKAATLPQVGEEKVFSPMVVMGQTYTTRQDAGKAILEICKKITNPEARPLGEYRGLKTEIGYDTIQREYFINCKGKMTYCVMLGHDAGGIITRIDNAIDGIEKRIQYCTEQLANVHNQVENAKAQIAAPFPDEEILEAKSKRLDELNSELNMDRRESEIAEDAVEESGEDTPQRSNRDDRDER